jgi:hypothetical protein
MRASWTYAFETPNPKVAEERRRTYDLGNLSEIVFKYKDLRQAYGGNDDKMWLSN